MTQTLRYVHNKLTAKNLTVATAESLTAGMIAATLADQSGASAYLRGGIVAYTLDAKVDFLGVQREEAAACNCVSREVAKQMALGAREKFKVDYALAVTGYAEPGEHEEPFAHFAIAWSGGVLPGTVPGEGLTRNAMRRRVTLKVLQALAWLLRHNHA